MPITRPSMPAAPRSSAAAPRPTEASPVSTTVCSGYSTCGAPGRPTPASPASSPRAISTRRSASTSAAPTSLAGYPIGEASGDQGNEIHLELRRDFAAPWGGNLQTGLFYEQGWLKRFKDPWYALDTDNNFTLKTVGLQLTQTIESKWVIRGLVGRQVGPASPVDKLTGNNSDGQNESYRLWFQVIRYFGGM
jgi:hypothetical protein